MKLSYGDKLVGKRMDSHEKESVAKIRNDYAAIIDLLREYHSTAPTTPLDKTQNRLLEIAEEKAIEAQMWAVKALTYGDN